MKFPEISSKNKIYKEVRIIYFMKKREKQRESVLKRINANQIKAIIFDVGGVLNLGYYSSVSIRRHRCLGVHNYISRKLKISLDQWFNSIDSVYADAIEGKISQAKTLSIISKNLQISPKKLERLLVQDYHKNFRKNKKLYSLAIKLKKQGYKIAILSDQWGPSGKALIEKKYLKNFHPVIISCNVGIRKPNIKIYKLLLRKIKLKPTQCIFIDNQIWNLEPAKKLGIKTILFKNNVQCLKDLKKLGIRVK